MFKRTIVIGDPQGCSLEVLQLLDKVNFSTKDGDRVIFAGDLVDRGPDSARCLDHAYCFEVMQGAPAAVMGNHEARHLDYWKQEKAGKLSISNKSHIETRKQLKDRHYEYMAKMPLFIRLPEYNAIVVHAGLFPGKPVEEQDPYHLLHIQSICPEEGTKSKWPSKAPSHWKFWTNYYDGSERIIFGHSVLDKPLLTDKVCGIDGGCCFGLELRAVILPDWEIVSVPATGNYGHGKRGNQSEGVKMFDIHGDVKTWS
jgi:hypothetical protein